MNVFEDLIVELKEENLLETNVSEAEKQKKTKPEAVEPRKESDEVPAFDASDEESTELEGSTGDIEIEVVDEPAAKPKKAKPGKEFFNKRAVDEVASLQMVEHVLTGVEREYMKVVPKAFDDFNAKKALHIFVNIAETADSEEHKAAEFAVMRETEAWGMALLERDNGIPVSLLRQFCENSRPALSSQAMVALARFYRNAPYSESVRAKFDFVITRLFSRPVEIDKRVCLFGRNEMLTHIKKLYAEWSSIPLYDADEDDSNVMLTGLSFDDLAVEAESTSNFDRLIESDFFGRLRQFKESTNELFYEPSITVAAIGSNVRIGNAYVDLIFNERQKMDAESIEAKYSAFNEQSGSVSDAAGRTLELGGLLNGMTDDVILAQQIAVAEAKAVEAGNAPTPETAAAPEKEKAARSPFVERLIANIKGVNKVLVGVCLVMALVTAGLYVWSTHLVEEEVSTTGVTKVDLDNSVLSEHIKFGKISGETFYGILNPTWDGLQKEKREEYLQKVLEAGAEKGYKKVDLVSKNGENAGYASATRLEVYLP